LDSAENITPPFELYRDSFFVSAADKKQAYYYESIRDGYFTPGWKDNDIGLGAILGLMSESDTAVGRGGSKYVLAPKLDTANVYFYMIMRAADEAGRMINEGPMLGYSSSQEKYSSMMNKANSYYDAVNYTLYVLLLNHIASAIDAGFTARAYNAKLLGQESVWNRLSVEQQYVFTGSEVSPGIALKVRF
jgi:hypothetical protein